MKHTKTWWIHLAGFPVLVAGLYTATVGWFADDRSVTAHVLHGIAVVLISAGITAWVLAFPSKTKKNA